ncbi:hypothetical protein OROHE_024180 [Orobanche hederae]
MQFKNDKNPKNFSEEYAIPNSQSVLVVICHLILLKLLVCREGIMLLVFYMDCLEAGQLILSMYSTWTFEMFESLGAGAAHRTQGGRGVAIAPGELARRTVRPRAVQV